MKTEEIYQKVTNTIIELLETVKESDYNTFWNNIAFDAPKNIFKNTKYTGINFLYLLAVVQLKKYTTNNWLTFFEIQQLNAKIKKAVRQRK